MTFDKQKRAFDKYMKSIPEGQLPSCEKCPLKDKEHMTTDEKALTMFNLCIPCSSFKTNRKNEPRFTKEDLDEVEHYVSLNVSTIRLGPNVTATREAITVNTDEEPGRFTATISPCSDPDDIDLEIEDHGPVSAREHSFNYGLPLRIPLKRGDDAAKGQWKLTELVSYVRCMINQYLAISKSLQDTADSLRNLKCECLELSRLASEFNVRFPVGPKLNTWTDELIYRKPKETK